MPVTVDPRAPGSVPPGVVGRRAVAWAGIRALPWRPVLLSVLAARAVVLLALLSVHLLARQNPAIRELGLLSWDASWYRRIAEDGYPQLPVEAVRFFPLLPLLVRAAAVVLRSESVALLLLANGSAVLFGLLLHRLALREGLGGAVANRAVWVAAFVPAGFVNVMGYTEPLYGALVCGILLGARSGPVGSARRWWLVGALGFLVGVLRPPGVVLGAVVLLAALPGVRAAGLHERLARAVAVLSPAIGLGSYLLYVDDIYGDPLLPFRAQVDVTLRGGAFVNPLPGVRDAAVGALRGHLAGSGLHVLWALLAIGLLVVVARRLPASHTLLAAMTIVLGVTARSMTSFERYAGSTAPLLLGVALVMSGMRLRRVTLMLTTVLLGVYAAMAFAHRYVP